MHCDRQKGVGEDDGADDDGEVEEEEVEVWETMCGDNQQVTISRKHSSDAASQHSPVWPDNTHSHSVPSPAVAILTS